MNNFGKLGHLKKTQKGPPSSRSHSDPHCHTNGPFLTGNSDRGAGEVREFGKQPWLKGLCYQSKVRGGLAVQTPSSECGERGGTRLASQLRWYEWCTALCGGVPSLYPHLPSGPSQEAAGQAKPPNLGVEVGGWEGGRGNPGGQHASLLAAVKGIVSPKMVCPEKNRLRGPENSQTG